ncbi:MAG: hypothetical protein RIR46_158, partial [Actinomycetota bacterium]
MNQEFNNWADSLRGQKPLADVIADAKTGGAARAAKPSATVRTLKQLPTMHVGRAARYGNITWFPIFTDAPVVERAYGTEAFGKVAVVEGDVPSVATLNIKNDCDKPVLLLEGTLLEGGWQHRALTRTVVINAGETTALPVVCVEA